MIDLAMLGARPSTAADGTLQVAFAIDLPGITYPKGYRLEVRLIHERDQFTRGIEPDEAWMSWVEGSEHDRWEATVALMPGGIGHFGQPGRYLYRYQLLRGSVPVAFWFADPFGRDVGPGTQSMFTAGPAAPFPWTDAAFTVPEIDDLVVYELNVREFNLDFDGVVVQLDHLVALGVNCLELMPVTVVREDVEWGYTPLGYLAPDERLGGVDGMKRLVDACHGRGVAVIIDAVYAHAHPEFAYDQVYAASGEPSPMFGRFAGEFFGSRVGTDFAKRFTADYFAAVNEHWLAEFHVDGFRYDYVPGFYDGNPTGPGYPELVYRTYHHSRHVPRFAGPNGRSKIIQCAEHLPDPQRILATTYSNCAWQNGLLDRARDAARSGAIGSPLAHQLDPSLLGYPDEYHNPADGERFPVAPFQYIESHDHRRFVNELGVLQGADLLGEPYGDRRLAYRMQPYVIAMYVAKGIPMLWQGQELAENYGLPSQGLGRNLYERPLHWEYFYDEVGKALVRLHRILGALRRSRPSLRSRGWFWYLDDPAHRALSVIVIRRRADRPGAAADDLQIAINFSDRSAEVWMPFPRAGRWVERIDGTTSVDVATDGEWRAVTVPSNYGAILERS